MSNTKFEAWMSKRVSESEDLTKTDTFKSFEVFSECFAELEYEIRKALEQTPKMEQPCWFENYALQLFDELDWVQESLAVFRDQYLAGPED